MKTYSQSWTPITGSQYLLSERKDKPKDNEVRVAKANGLTIIITQDSWHWSDLNRDRSTMSPTEIDTRIVAHMLGSDDFIWRGEE